MECLINLLPPHVFKIIFDFVFSSTSERFVFRLVCKHWNHLLYDYLKIEAPYYNTLTIVSEWLLQQQQRLDSNTLQCFRAASRAKLLQLTLKHDSGFIFKFVHGDCIIGAPSITWRHYYPLERKMRRFPDSGLFIFEVLIDTKTGQLPLIASVDIEARLPRGTYSNDLTSFTIVLEKTSRNLSIHDSFIFLKYGGLVIQKVGSDADDGMDKHTVNFCHMETQGPLITKSGLYLKSNEIAEIESKVMCNLKCACQILTSNQLDFFPFENGDPSSVYPYEAEQTKNSKEHMDEMLRRRKNTIQNEAIISRFSDQVLSHFTTQIEIQQVLSILTLEIAKLDIPRHLKVSTIPNHSEDSSSPPPQKRRKVASDSSSSSSPTLLPFSIVPLSTSYVNTLSSPFSSLSRVELLITQEKITWCRPFTLFFREVLKYLMDDLYHITKIRLRCSVYYIEDEFLKKVVEVRATYANNTRSPYVKLASSNKSGVTNALYYLYVSYFDSEISFKQFLQLLIHPDTSLLAENIFDNPLNLPLGGKRCQYQNMNKGSATTHSTNTHSTKSGSRFLGAVADWILNASS